jgi:hypothetical protein
MEQKSENERVIELLEQIAASLTRIETGQRYALRGHGSSLRRRLAAANAASSVSPMPSPYRLGDPR